MDAMSRISECEERLNVLNRDFEIRILEQEHRFLPALGNLLRVLFKERGDSRRQLAPATIKAFAWCLIPSPAAGAVGIIALLTLFVTMHQSSLLQSQNRKMEIQNILSEAQRRSALMFETAAIFEALDAEKSSNLKTACEAANSDSCWKSFADGSTLYVPSSATIGRLAALTQALRPYRYLRVEGVEQRLCPQDTRSVALDDLYARLLATRLTAGPPQQLSVEDAKALAEKAWVLASQRQATLRKFQSFFGRLVGGLVGDPESSTEPPLSCSPTSPERGQLLVSLHASKVDVSAIVKGGGNFSYADIPGANLSGLRLEDVSLEGANLPGSSFRNASLSNVNFRGADLNAARFAGARISKSDFEGARIQVFQKAGDAPLFFTPGGADDVLLSGIRLYERSESPNLFDRLCLTLFLPSALALESARKGFAQGAVAGSFEDLSGYALLVETARDKDTSQIEQRATLMFGVGLTRTVLLEKPRAVHVEYIPISDCVKH